MKRAVIAALALVLLAGAVWVIFLKGRGEQRVVKKDAGAPAPAARRQPGGGGEQAEEGERALVIDDDPAGKLRLEGIVLDVADEPVAGALVSIDANPPRATRSGDDGTFAFDALLPRPYRLVAHADEGSAGPVTARLTATSDPVTLRLQPAATVEVTVVAAGDRAPVAGATVELRAVGVLTGATGADGVATFRNVPAGRWSVVSWSTGFARGFQDLGVARGASVVEKVTVVLRKGAPVSGVVRDQQGNPVAEAAVAWSGASDWFDDADPRRDGAVTDASGRFRFDALAAGTVRFTARHRDFAPGTSEQVTLDGVSARDGVEIVLDHGGTLAGRVIDRGGQPVAGATIRVAVREGRDDLRQGLSGDDGRFELKALPRKPVAAVAVHESATSETVDVDLAAADRAEVTLSLDLDGTIAGIVVDDAGEPVPEAQVVAFPDMRGAGRGARREVMGEFRLRGFAQERADAGGRFELRGLRPGEYRLRAGRSGSSSAMRGGPMMRDGTPASVGDKDVRLVLEQPAVVKGKVQLAETGAAPSMFVVAAGFGGGSPFATEDGSFELEDVPPGERNLVITGPEFDRTEVAATIEAGKTTDVGTISVRRGRMITGRVLDASGRPVAGATVLAGRRLIGSGASAETQAGERMFGGRGSTRRATSDDAGNYTLYGVGSRELALLAEHETEGRSTTLSVPAGDDPITLDLMLAPFAALQGKVTRGGAPVDGCRVAVTSQKVPSASFAVVTGPDGAYRFDRLAADQYLVQALEGSNPMTGMGMHTQVVSLPAGQTRTVDIAFPDQVGTLLVSVTVTEGEAPRAVEVRALPGQATPVTLADVERAAAAAGEGDHAFVIALMGNPGTLRLRFGRYTVCAVPFPNELRGPEAVAYREREKDNLRAFCVPAEIADTSERAITIPVVPAALIPGPEAQTPGRAPPLP